MSLNGKQVALLEEIENKPRKSGTELKTLETLYEMSKPKSVGGFMGNVVSGCKNVMQGGLDTIKGMSPTTMVQDVVKGQMPMPVKMVGSMLEEGGDVLGSGLAYALKLITGKTPMQMLPNAKPQDVASEKQGMQELAGTVKKYTTDLPNTLYNEPAETAARVLPFLMGGKGLFKPKTSSFGRVSMAKQPMETIIPKLKSEFLEMSKIRGDAYIEGVKSYIKPETRVDFSQAFKDLEPTEAGYNKIVKNLPKKYRALVENPELAESLDPLEAIKIRNSIPYDNGYSGEFRNELAIKVGEAIPEIRTTINPKFKLALADQKAMNKFIRESSPDTLYHALTDPEYAIKNPGMAKIIMRNLSTEAQELVKNFRQFSGLKKVLSKIPVIGKTRDYFKKPEKK